MTMGVRGDRQEALFVTADELPKSQGHPFYVKLNTLLREAGFDLWIERRCRRYYEQRERRGRPSLPPGVYFRMLLVGYFAGLAALAQLLSRMALTLHIAFQASGTRPHAPTAPPPSANPATESRLVQRRARLPNRSLHHDRDLRFRDFAIETLKRLDEKALCHTNRPRDFTSPAVTCEQPDLCLGLGSGGFRCGLCDVHYERAP